jgi:alpha-tubulin suppressor-like RCC1 family protein
MVTLAQRSLILGLVTASIVGVAAAASRTASPSASGLAVARYNSCAVLRNAVECWGANDRQFENSSREDIRVPIRVANLPRRPAAIALGATSLCVHTSAGGLRCWGKNQFGTLGNGTLHSSPTPVDVTGLRSGVEMVASGPNHVCALIRGGRLKCWGYNLDGQLGNGTSSIQPKTRPVSVVGLGGTAKALTLGNSHTCALMSGASVKCWGSGSDGELGNGKRRESDTPVAVAGLNGVKAVSAGSSFTCALTSRGGVQCWGANRFGELGNGTHKSSSKPVAVSGLKTGVKAIAAGTSHSCALTNAGAVKCWGSNVDGALGNGKRKNESTPVAVRGLATGVRAIGVGDFYSCALTSTGVKCWGRNQYGQLGNGKQQDSRVPVAVLLRAA